MAMLGPRAESDFRTKFLQLLVTSFEEKVIMNTKDPTRQTTVDDTDRDAKMFVSWSLL